MRCLRRRSIERYTRGNGSHYAVVVFYEKKINKDTYLNACKTHGCTPKYRRTDPTTVASSQRIHWIDIAKGIGIILVSFGHIRNGDGQSVWLPALDTPINIIYLFHMPLFFFLGGLTFSSRRQFPDFLKVKAKTLLIPYYIFSLYFIAKPIAVLLIPSLGASMQANHDYSNIGLQLYDVLINGSGLWFLWAYFIGELVVYPLDRWFTTKYQYLVSGFLLIAVSILFGKCLPGVTLPFQIVSGVEVAGFILLGIACKQTLQTFTNRGLIWVLFIIVLAAFLAIAFPALSFSTKPWGVLISALAMFLGVAAGVLLSMAIMKNAVLEYIGRHSLSFYVVNAITLNIGKIVFFKLLHIDGTQANIAMQWVYGILLTIFCLGLLALEDIIIRALIPWSLGIKRQKRLQKETDAI